VLGGMVLDSTCIGTVREIVAEGDFYRPAHQSIYSALCSLAANNQPIDLVMLRGALTKEGKLESVGGTAYLIEMVSGVPDTSNAPYYARLVRDASILRQLVQLGMRLSGEAMSPRTDATELLSNYQQAIYDIDRRMKSDRRYEQSAYDAGNDVLVQAEKVQRGDASAGRMYKTGFPEIDAAMHGLRPGHLTIVGGSTSVGKSMFALGVAADVAAQGGAVLYVSAEMPPIELGQRLLQASARVSGNRIIRGDLDTDHWERLQQAEGELVDRRLHLVGRAMSLAEIAMKARSVAMTWGVPINLIVIDYLQIMRLPSGRELRERVGAFTGGAKQLAMDLGCNVMVLSQLSREDTKRPGPPHLHGLKESGSIEADANEVILLHRPTEINPTLDEHGWTWYPLWAQVAKCRDGQITAWPDSENGGIVLKSYPSITLLRP